MNADEITDLAGHRNVPPWVVKLVQDAVEAERKACIDICKKDAQEYGDYYQLAARGACMALAQAIAKRGQE